MIDHELDLAHVREATERLLTAAASLDNAGAAEPSRLPGWTRGHVLAHVARNADALVNVLQGLPMYPDAATRDADIERDSGRPLDVHLADLRATADRFQAVGAEPADWSRTVELRNGVTDSASRIPFRRWVEVDLHHVDLGIGYELEDLPEEFVSREIDFLADRFTGLESVAGDDPPGRRRPGVEDRRHDGRRRRHGRRRRDPRLAGRTPRRLGPAHRGRPAAAAPRAVARAPPAGGRD